MPDGIKKQGAAAIDEIVMGMQLSGVDRVKQLLAGGFHQEAIKEANRLSPEDLRKLAADLTVPATPNEVEQTESAVSPPKENVEQEHELDENSTVGEPNSQPGEKAAPAHADINPVEGADNSDTIETPRAPTQIEEEATPPPTTEEAPGNTEDPKEEHPTTTVPENEVSVETKQAQEEETPPAAAEPAKETVEEVMEESETKDEGAEEEPKEAAETCDSGSEEPKEEKKEEATEEPAEEPKEAAEQDPLKAASLQGYVKGSQDALLAIIRSLQK